MNFTTLCYIEKENKYLMLHRTSKKKDGNKDKWIGVGGHFEKGESPEECLLREVKEETGLELTSYQFRGIVTFISDEWPDEYMCLYTCLLYTSDAADDSLRVDLGGRRIIKKNFFKAEDGIRDPEMSRGLGDVYKRQAYILSISRNRYFYIG